MEKGDIGVKENSLTAFLEQYMDQTSIFSNKEVLDTDFTPTSILHRDEQIKAVASVLAPILKQERPNNLFISGNTGTGKTLVTVFTTEQIRKAALQHNLSVRIMYVNCKLKRTADTEYRLIAHLCNELGREVHATGLPTDEVYRIFYDELDKKELTLLLILDEIDALIDKSDDQLLYNLLRINEHIKQSKISIVGISNKTYFGDSLDPRVKSSLSEENIFFPRYNAVQLLAILKDRASSAFCQGAIEEGVLEKCAAFTAQDHGDARLAISLLKTAGHICDRNNEKKLQIKHLDLAESAIEHDNIINAVRTQPKQHQATLYAILNTCSSRKQGVFTGEIYERYQHVCDQIQLRPLTQRRISDIIQEFDMLGIIQCKVISKGRYGRTREITLSLPSNTMTKVHDIITEGLSIS